MTDVRYSTTQNDTSSPALAGWQTAAPRDEICPTFAYEPQGGPGDQGAFIIEADQRAGLDGYWTKTFPVTGGSYYQFRARYRAQNVAVPRRSVVAKIDWRDAQGEPVPEDQPTVAEKLLAMGAGLRLEILHMEGPLPKAG